MWRAAKGSAPIRCCEAGAAAFEFAADFSALAASAAIGIMRQLDLHQCGRGDPGRHNTQVKRVGAPDGRRSVQAAKAGVLVSGVCEAGGKSHDLGRATANRRRTGRGSRSHRDRGEGSGREEPGLTEDRGREWRLWKI